MRKFMLFVAALVATLGLAQLQIGAAGASPVPGLSASKSNSATQVNTSTQSAQNWSKTVQVAPVTNIAPELALFGSNGGSSVVSAPSSTTDQSVNQTALQANGASQSGEATASSPKAGDDSGNCGCTSGEPPKANGDDHSHGCGCTPQPSTPPKADHDHSGNCGCTSGEPPKANGDDDHSHDCGRNSGGPTAAWEGNTESQSNSLSQSNSSSQEASNSSTTEQIAPVTNVAPELAVLGSTGGSTVISSPSSSTTQGVSQGVAQLNGAQQSGQASNVGP